MPLGASPIILMAPQPGAGDSILVTEPEATPDNESAVAETGQDQEAREPTVEELRARLEQEIAARKSAEGRVKSMQRNNAISGEALADMEQRIAASTQKAIQVAFENEDPQERAKELAQIYREQDEQRALAKRITDAQPSLDDLVERAGKDFSDPMFADSRTAWDSGRPEEAVALARIAVNEARSGNTYTKEETEAMVQAAVKNALSSANRVDTGGSTVAVSSDQKPTTRAELATYMAQRRAAGNPVPASEHAALIAGLRN